MPGGHTIEYGWRNARTDFVVYTRDLFGWTFRTVGNYSIASNADRPLCGMFQRPRPKDQSAHPRWFGYVSTSSVARAQRDVLKLGGRFLCLEFSSVDVPGLDTLYELYSFQVIPRIGNAVTGDREAYQYLVESIRKFPKPKLFAAMLETAGFRRVSFTPMTGGVVALHSGWRL